MNIGLTPCSLVDKYQTSQGACYSHRYLKIAQKMKIEFSLKYSCIYTSLQN
jgi:hypothetical protein